MKVLLVLHELPEPDGAAALGGVQAHVLDLAGELTRNGHAVEILTGHPLAQDRGRTSRRAGQPPVTVLTRRVKGPGPARFIATVADRDIDRRFRELVLQMRPDVVHIHHFMYLSMGLVETLRAEGVPFVATVHDHGLVCHRLFLVKADGTPCAGPGLHCGPCNRGPGPAGWLASPAFALRNWLARRAGAGIPLVISPSYYLARFYETNGIPASHIRVIPTGIPRARHRQHAIGTPVRFAFAGMLRPHKGAHVALEAFGLLDHALSALTIHGDPAVDPAYGEAVRRACAATGAKLLPPFERDEIDRALDDVDCVLYPSLAAENAPLLARECLARGIPVLASRSGGLPETAPEGKGIRYFAAGDTAALSGLMDRYARHPDELAALAKDSPPMPALEEHVRAIEAIYAEAIARTRGLLA